MRLFGNRLSTFIELDKTIHDRDTFDCGEPELNRFLKTQAAKHMKTGLSLTQVSTISVPDQKQPIKAFFTVAPSAIQRDHVPPALAKKLPHYPIPVFLIAQLAVDKTMQGQGIGKLCLITALNYLWSVHKHMHAYAVVVDCLNDAAAKFYRTFGFTALCVHQHRARLFIPMKTVGQLFTS